MKKRKIKIKSIIISLVAFCIIGIISYFVIDKSIQNNLSIELNGDKEIVLNYKDEYKELGAKALYKNKDLTNNIEISSNLDTNHIGTYNIDYKIKYKNKIKKTFRTIKVVDNEKPLINLKEDKLVLIEGNPYKELGAVATDNYDGDISNKIEIDTSKIDNNTPGDYVVTYKVKDSSGNESVIDRNVSVVKKAPADQKIAVLNYHFFYKDYDENCHEALCENIETFRKQLQYLKDNDYYTLTIDEFTKWMYGELEVPEKSVLITIDDGAHGTSKINGNHLIPALEDFKMHATLFLITGWWDIENYRSDYLDIQSHTNDLHYEANCGHRSKVNCVSYNELLSDLKKSIDIIGDSNSFCFPFYDYTENSIKAVKEAGFKISFVGGRRKASRSDDKYKIPRYPIYDYTSMESFINMVS